MNREQQELDRLINGLRLCGISGRGMFSRIAEKTGYTLSMVGKVLSGKVEMGERFLKVVCSAFGINEEWVLEGKEPAVRCILTDSWTGQPPVIFEGQRLSEVRETLGYSSEEMAEQLETDINTLQQCEQELFIKNIQALRRLALLGININWLYTGRGEIRLNQWPITIISRDGRKFDIDNLFAIRLEKNLGNRTTEWLAQESNIDPLKIEKFISGESFPTVNQLIAMADALGVNPAWLSTTDNLQEKRSYERFLKENVPVSAELYKSALIAVEAFLIEAALNPTAEKKADIVNFLCQAHMKETPDSKEIDSEMVRQLVRLAT